MELKVRPEFGDIIILSFMFHHEFGSEFGGDTPTLIRLCEFGISLGLESSIL